MRKTSTTAVKPSLPASPDTRFKLIHVNDDGTTDYVGRLCGGLTLGEDAGFTWDKEEADYAIRILEKLWGKIELVAA